MLEFKTLEELRANEELRNMGKNHYKKVLLNGSRVIACTTDQQYDDMIWGGVYEIIERLNGRYDLSIDEYDLASETRDFILEKIYQDYDVEFVDVYEEY